MRLKKIIYTNRSWLKEEFVDFKAMLPLQLKNSVSGKSEKDKQNPCIQEMMSLFACLKKNDYDQTPCNQEIDILNSCHKSYKITSKHEKDQLRMGILSPGAKNLNHRQLNMLLKKYPTS